MDVVSFYVYLFCTHQFKVDVTVCVIGAAFTDRDNEDPLRSEAVFFFFLFFP